jgi:tetratricopeptide (TPR) repeat protein
MFSLANIAAAQGRCDEYVALTHQLATVSPKDGDARELEAVALYAKEWRDGTDFSTFRVAADTAIARANPAEVEPIRFLFDISSEIAQGRLSDALREFETWRTRHRAETDEEILRGYYFGELQLLEEMGRSRDAERFARQWLLEAPTWIPSTVSSSRIVPLATLYRLHAISRESFIEERRRWLDSERTRGATQPASYRWTDAYSNAIVTRDDAVEALATLSDYASSMRAGANAYVDAAVGCAYAAAERSEEAAEFLRAATHACPNFQNPMGEVQTLESLGEVLARSADKSRACAAFDTVLRHWERTATSRTAARARAASAQLSCDRPD